MIFWWEWNWDLMIFKEWNWDLMILMGMKLGFDDFDGNETGDLVILMGMKLGISWFWWERNWFWWERNWFWWEWNWGFDDFDGKETGFDGNETGDLMILMGIKLGFDDFDGNETGDLMILKEWNCGFDDFDGNETGDLMILTGMKLGIWWFWWEWNWWFDDSDGNETGIWWFWWKETGDLMILIGIRHKRGGQLTIWKSITEWHFKQGTMLLTIGRGTKDYLRDVLGWILHGIGWIPDRTGARMIMTLPGKLVGGLEHQFYFPIYWE